MRTSIRSKILLAALTALAATGCAHTSASRADRRTADVDVSAEILSQSPGMLSCRFFLRSDVADYESGEVEHNLRLARRNHVNFDIGPFNIDMGANPGNESESSTAELRVFAGGQQTPVSRASWVGDLPQYDLGGHGMTGLNSVSDPSRPGVELQYYCKVER